MENAYPAVRLDTFHVDSGYKPDAWRLVWVFRATLDSQLIHTTFVTRLKNTTHSTFDLS